MVLFSALLFLLDLLVFVGLPGTWIALGCVAIYAFATRLAVVGWGMLLAMTLVCVVGEIVESLLGIVYVSRRGASKRGTFGAFAGGIAGAVLGTAIVPIVGSMIFAFVGAFAGAVALEYLAYRSMDRALRTGFFAFMGKLLASLAKFALGLVVVGLFLYSVFRR